MLEVAKGEAIQAVDATRNPCSNNETRTGRQWSSLKCAVPTGSKLTGSKVKTSFLFAIVRNVLNIGKIVASYVWLM